MNQLHRNLTLAGVLVGAGVLSAYAFQPDDSARATVPRAEPAAQPGPSNPRADEEDEAPSTAEIQGEVAEIIDVDKYTYLRLTQPGGEDVWTAVPLAKVTKGQRVAVADPQMMRQFKSTTLDRTFDVIYFGQLAERGSSQGSSTAMPPGHPPTGTTEPGAMPPGHPPTGTDPGVNPHTMGSHPGEGISVGAGEVAKATGPGAHRIIELYGDKKGLSGQKVRVRGVVVKAVPNVMNRTFLHLRDGTGDEHTGTHDLTVTTAADAPEIGSTVTATGMLVTDRDFGAGYTYPVLVEDAELVNE